MGKFNQNKEQLKTYEGGRGYVRNPLKQWVNFMMGSRLEAGFYETQADHVYRITTLTEEIIKTYGARFAAKVAVFSRDVLGMRSVSQLVAAILNRHNFEGKRIFYANYFTRPDDVAEVFAIIEFFEEKRSHALVRGACDYLSLLNEYSLGKYKLARKEYNMYDLINITHAHSAAIDAFKADELEVPDTWETAISANLSEEERDKEWIRLVSEGKLGYMALLRNLRNITSAAEAVFKRVDIYGKGFVSCLCDQLTSKNKIRKSKVFPYRIYTAYKILTYQYCICSSYLRSEIISALQDAFVLAVDNMPKLKGSNVVILDVSGSMDQAISLQSCVSVLQASACQAMAMIIANPDTAVIKFGTEAVVSTKFSDSKLDYFGYIDYLCNNQRCGHGTCLDSVVNILNLLPSIDRIFLFSDMQVMLETGYWAQTDTFKSWMDQHSNTYLYSYDLGQYATSAVSDTERFIFISALNDSIYKIIPYFEEEDGLEKFIGQMTYLKQY